MKHVSLLWDYSSSLQRNADIYPASKITSSILAEILFASLFSTGGERNTAKEGNFQRLRGYRARFEGRVPRFARNEVTRPEPSLSVSRVLYPPISRDALYAEKQAYKRGEDDAPYPERYIFDLLCVVRVLAYVRKYVTRGTYLWTECSSSAAAESLEVSLYLASGIVARAG